jgi:hypothetical protein
MTADGHTSFDQSETNANARVVEEVNGRDRIGLDVPGSNAYGRTSRHYFAFSLTAVVAALVLVAVSAAAPSPDVRVPRPTGQFHVGTRTMSLTDPARRDPQHGKQPRSVVIQFFYPTAVTGLPARYLSPAVARFIAKNNGVTPALLQGVKLNATANSAPLRRRGGWPVVLFSPGFGVERGLYASLTVDLASHGYVVVAIDHPGDAEIVEFPDGHVVLPTSQMDIQKAFTVRVADARFVLTQLSRLERSGVFKGGLDLGRIGMFGHSLGGAAAASTMLVDRRVRAGADLDGLLFGQVRTRGLSRPFLLMSGEPGFAADPNRSSFWKGLHCPHYAVDVKRAEHFAFSDIAFLVPVLMRANPAAGAAAKQLVGNIDGLATLAAERAYISAFFDRYLRGKPQPLLSKTPGPFAGVRLTVAG